MRKFLFTSVFLFCAGSAFAQGEAVGRNPSTKILRDYQTVGLAHTRLDLTGLTGGATKLDGVVTAAGALKANTVFQLIISSELVTYRLRAGTDAESSPSIIRPDDYNASTNAFVWEKVSAAAPDLSGYVPTSRTINGHALSANITLAKSDIGLGSVDNTADSAKPISTLTQAALDLKSNAENAALTGVPTAPTAAADTSTTQIATTAFSKAEADAAQSAAATDATTKANAAQAAAVQRSNHTGTAETGVNSITSATGTPLTLKAFDAASSPTGFVRIGVNTETADANYKGIVFGPSDVFQHAYQLATNESVQNKVFKFGYRPADAPASGDIRAYMQIESGYKALPAYDTEYMLQWWGPDGAYGRRPFFITTSWGSGYASSDPIGYTRFAINANEFTVGDSGSGGGQPYGMRVSFTTDGDATQLFRASAANKSARLVVSNDNTADWLALVAGTGGAYVQGSNEMSLDVVGNGSNRDFYIRRSANGGSSYTKAFQITNNGRFLWNNPTDDGANTHQFQGNTKVTGDLSITTDILVNSGSGTSAIGIGDMGTAATGIWLFNSTPSTANFGLGGSANETVLNAPSTKTLYLRIGNDSAQGVTFTTTAATFNKTTEAAPGGTGAVLFAGGVHVAKRIVTPSTITAGTLVAAKTSAYPVVATEPRTLFTNEGASAGVTFTLPTAVANLSYTFVVQDADGVTITAASGDTIRFAGTVTAAAGSIASTTIGSTITLVAINATEWIAISVVGTWA
jgi:hypothetical protein